MKGERPPEGPPNQPPKRITGAGDDPLREWRQLHGQMLEALLRIEALACAGIPDGWIVKRVGGDLQDLAAAVRRCLAALAQTTPSEVIEIYFKAAQKGDWEARREEMARKFRRSIETGANANQIDGVEE